MGLWVLVLGCGVLVVSYVPQSSFYNYPTYPIHKTHTPQPKTNTQKPKNQKPHNTFTSIKMCHHYTFMDVKM